MLLRKRLRKANRISRAPLQLEELDTRAVPATFAIADTSIIEGDEGAVNMVFTVTRTGDLGATASVGYNAVAGSATVNVDFVPTSGTLSFGPNVTTQTVNVPILGDYDHEPDETLTLQLTPGVLDRRGPTVQFAGRQDIAIGNNPIGVSWGDFNSDGLPDAAAAMGGTNFGSAIVNTTSPGSGTISFNNRVDAISGSGPSDTATADFNLDGRVDLVAVTDPSSGVFTYRNDTTPGSATLSFSPQVAFSGIALGNKSVTIGDFNRDGRPDIAVGTSNPEIVIWLNDTAPGSATFAFQPAFSLPAGSIVQGMVVGDLNLDGNPDLAMAGRTSGFLSVFLNTTPANATTPSFAARVNFTAGNEPFGVAAGDINRDGMPDLVVTNHSGGTASMFRNTMSPGATTATFAIKVDISVSAGPIGVALVDLNGDGKVELITGGDTGSNLVVWTNATPANAASFTFVSKLDITGVQQGRSLVVVDYNSDGKPDLAAGMSGGTGIAVFLNTTAATTSASDFANTAFATAATTSRIATGDFNNDGKPDIISGTSGAVVLVNITAPGSLTPTYATQSPAVNFSFLAWTVGDVNRDGRLDLIAGDGIYLNTTPVNAATVTFSSKTPFAFASSIDSVIRLGDFDLDGRLDVLSTRRDIAIGTDFRVFRNTTTPGATTPTFAANIDFSSGNINCIDAALADLNLDGKLDVTLSTGGDGVTPSTRGLAMLLNTTPSGSAAITFGTTNRFATTRVPGSVVTGDINNDGKPDLAFINANPATPNATILSTYINQTAPNSTFISLTARQDFQAAAGPLTLVEMDGDGRLDIVAIGLSSQQNRVFVFQNQTTPGGTTAAFATPLETLANTPNVSLATADFNGDGRLDLAIGQSGTSLNIALNQAYLFTQSSATGTIVDNDPAPDLTAPGVAAVYLNGTLWAPAFQSALGSINGFAAQTGSQQLVTLPWNRINQIRIQFTENVTVSQSNLALRGLNVANYAVTGFGYDGVNFVGIWTLSGNIATDRLIIDLDGDSAAGVVDLANNKLAGSWTESVSTFPTTGAPATDFKFRFNVQVGDANRSGGPVSNGDLNVVRNSLFTSVGDAGYSIFNDIDGTGGISNPDVNAVRASLFSDLPPGPGPFRPIHGTSSRDRQPRFNENRSGYATATTRESDSLQQTKPRLRQRTIPRTSTNAIDEVLRDF